MNYKRFLKLIVWLIFLGLIGWQGREWIVKQFDKEEQEASLQAGIRDMQEEKSRLGFKQKLGDSLGLEIEQIVKERFRWQAITKQGWKILFNPREDMDKQIKKAVAAYKKIDPKERESLEYIGVDVKDQVYLRTK